jgi:hypothetical protein
MEGMETLTQRWDLTRELVLDQSAHSQVAASFAADIEQALEQRRAALRAEGWRLTDDGKAVKV